MFLIYNNGMINLAHIFKIEKMSNQVKFIPEVDREPLYVAFSSPQNVEAHYSQIVQAILKGEDKEFNLDMYKN